MSATYDVLVLGGRGYRTQRSIGLSAAHDVESRHSLPRKDSRKVHIPR
jgi:hypothetical protein